MDIGVVTCAKLESTHMRNTIYENTYMRVLLILSNGGGLSCDQEFRYRCSIFVVLVFEFIQTRRKVHKYTVNRNNYRFVYSAILARIFLMRSSALRLEKQMMAGIMAALKCGVLRVAISFYRKRFHSHKKDAHHVPLFQGLPDAP